MEATNCDFTLVLGFCVGTGTTSSAEACIVAGEAAVDFDALCSAGAAGAEAVCVAAMAGIGLVILNMLETFSPEYFAAVSDVIEAFKKP